MSVDRQGKIGMLPLDFTISPRINGLKDMTTPEKRGLMMRADAPEIVDHISQNQEIDEKGKKSGFQESKENNADLKIKSIREEGKGTLEIPGPMTHETEEDLLKETEDEFEISLQNSPNQPSQGDNWDMLADTQEFNNTFGKTEDDQGMQVFFSNSKQSVNNKETAKEDIIVGETESPSKKHKSSNERNIFEQNIEVLDFKFNGDVSETSSRDMTIESVSNPENTQKNSLKDTIKGQFETKSKTHFSFQTDPFRKTGANQKKGEATHVAKNPQSDRVFNLRKKSNSSNLEISPLKQLLNNLKMSMFKSKDEYQKQLRFERKNRFGSINHVSSKTLNLKKKLKVSTERKTTNGSSKNKVQRSDLFIYFFILKSVFESIFGSKSKTL